MSSTTLKTYGRRQARPLKQSKQNLLETLLPAITIATPQDNIRSMKEIFPSVERPVWFEVGFGGGEHLAAQASTNSEINFIGCEPFINGVASLLSHIDTYQLKNIRIYQANALDLLEKMPDHSIDRMFLLFADPWPKKRHHKRRFIQPKILELISKKLAPNGFFYIATDHADYQQWILKHLEASPYFNNTFQSFEKPQDWPDTRYEQKAIKEGRHPLYLIYQNNSDAIL